MLEQAAERIDREQSNARDGDSDRGGNESVAFRPAAQRERVTEQHKRRRGYDESTITEAGLPAQVGCTWLHTKGVLQRVAYAVDKGIRCVQIQQPFWQPLNDLELIRRGPEQTISVPASAPPDLPRIGTAGHRDRGLGEGLGRGLREGLGRGLREGPGRGLWPCGSSTCPGAGPRPGYFFGFGSRTSTWTPASRNAAT